MENVHIHEPERIRTMDFREPDHLCNLPVRFAEVPSIRLPLGQLVRLGIE